MYIIILLGTEKSNRLELWGGDSFLLEDNIFQIPCPEYYSYILSVTCNKNNEPTQQYVYFPQSSLAHLNVHVKPRYDFPFGNVIRSAYLVQANLKRKISK